MNNEESVKDRLLRFLKAEKLSKTEFARRMDVSVAYVSAMRKSLPEEKVKKLCSLFPTLNRDWLLYGEGEMYLPRHQKGDPDTDGYTIPLLPVEAYAGNLQIYSRGVRPEECSRIHCFVQGADMAIPITGDSMEPMIQNGSIAIIARINERAFIPWGSPLVIDTENGVLLKVVYPSEKGDNYIKAHSFNPRYPDFQIPVNSIYGMYRVVGLMQKFSTI